MTATDELTDGADYEGVEDDGLLVSHPLLYGSGAGCNIDCGGDDGEMGRKKRERMKSRRVEVDADGGRRKIVNAIGKGVRFGEGISANRTSTEPFFVTYEVLVRARHC